MSDFYKYSPPLGWQAPYVGIPYNFHGVDHSGIGCWALACLVWKEQADVILPSFAESLPPKGEFSTERVRAVNQLIRDEIEIMTEITKPCPLALVQMRKGRFLTHIGIYAFGGWILHADEDAGAVVQDQMDDLKSSITGYYWPSDAVLSA